MVRFFNASGCIGLQLEVVRCDIVIGFLISDLTSMGGQPLRMLLGPAQTATMLVAFGVSREELDEMFRGEVGHRLKTLVSTVEETMFGEAGEGDDDKR